jgi:2,3,4,5-tetrahydropyridine-2-carboxylate N-succinyltransferase
MKAIIEKAWELREEISEFDSSTIAAIKEALKGLDEGKISVSEKVNGLWVTNTWLKKAILLSFLLYKNSIVPGFHAYDKIPLKFEKWDESDWQASGFRVVPGAIVRYSAYIAKKVVLMPSFINVGAYVGEATLIDTWATIGSCARIGNNCHISGGVGIGGVLEPLQANPVIIEDNVFIGARSEIAEGVIVGCGSVIAMGVFIGASTRIYDRKTGEIFYGRIPDYSVVVPGTLPGSDGKTQISAAIIVKRVDERTRNKTSINELLRS